MRQSSNPVFRSLTRLGAQGGAQAGAYQSYQYGQQQAPYNYQAPATSRTLSVDDIVAKTATSLAVLSVTAVLSYLLTASNPALGGVVAMVSGLVGLGLILFATFGRQQDNPAVVLGYSVAEGLLVGAFTNVLTIPFAGVEAGKLILEALIGTFGVFAGMLAVYKTGAVRVTPRSTRVFVGLLSGVVALMLVNFIASFFMAGGLGLRGHGPIAIIFSLICIGLAAYSFLVDFDQADQLIRAGAPQKAAWGVALGLTVTVVWLYMEILRLVVNLNSND
ncbi:MAG: Bax inhibitor-1/YccA family protein [Segniliparus sp.]|uniref:Bax inhibitor-1/YccA family protein n=1 Tax=Segniliparus sp. TaxID=2804064 RepID=UPI003F2DEE71